MKGSRSIITGIVLLLIGIFILVPVIKILSMIVVLILGIWFIWKGIKTLNK